MRIQIRNQNGFYQESLGTREKFKIEVLEVPIGERGRFFEFTLKYVTFPFTPIIWEFLGFTFTGGVDFSLCLI